MSTKFAWQFHRLGIASLDTPSELDMWIPHIQRIYCNGFGLEKKWPAESIQRKLSHSSLLGFLIEENNPSLAPVGYAIYYSPNEFFEGGAILWEGSICIAKDPRVRNKGYARIAPTKAMELFPGVKFCFIGGRTQNPSVLKRYATFGKLFPFDLPYKSDRGQSLMLFLKKNIVDVKNAKRLDSLTGICNAEYVSGKLGDYEIIVKGAEPFEMALKEKDFRFNRENGDAIIVVADLQTKPVLAI